MSCVAGPTASAAPCPDAEIVFARGTTEAPGVGPVGDAFVSAVQARVAPKSVGVYAVDYPATMAFSTAMQGIVDARSHILATTAACPTTKLVLGGFSQGAAVMGFVTASVVPDGVRQTDVPAPMPPEIADHVAAVALFGKPSARFMNVIKDPDVEVGPSYVGKALELCVDDDLVCDPHGRSFSVHNTYVEAGMVDQGATFAAQRLQALWAADAAAGTEPGPAGVVDQDPSQHLAPGVPIAPGAVPPPGPTALTYSPTS
ncbi:cutinase family protein [Mycobacterium yunnanensis]|uniref:Cutinase family protein n=2 Tax=Mycobacterium yunnanensis TaxID=368477 RepID=A0A9X2Z2S3_9MYCO|nr:cutinase family protein [Mycobacterium yunnanensis]